MICLRIKREWLDKIKDGTKTVEYRQYKEFYHRLFKNYEHWELPTPIKFLCGKEVYECLLKEIVIYEDEYKDEKTQETVEVIRTYGLFLSRQ